MLDYTEHIERLFQHIADTVPEFSYIDLRRILVGISKAKKRSGVVLAYVVPLRFENGARTMVKNGLVWQAPKVKVNGYEVLYVVRFLLPRFQNLQFKEKVATIFHELYHISPKMNGDLRRFPGRNAIHTSSTREFQESMKVMANEYLRNLDDPDVVRFLRPDFATLKRRFGPITGRTVRVPGPVLLQKAGGQMELKF